MKATEIQTVGSTVALDYRTASVFQKYQAPGTQGQLPVHLSCLPSFFSQAVQGAIPLNIRIDPGDRGKCAGGEEGGGDEEVRSEEGTGQEGTGQEDSSEEEGCQARCLTWRARFASGALARRSRHARAAPQSVPPPAGRRASARRLRAAADPLLRSGRPRAGMTNGPPPAGLHASASPSQAADRWARSTRSARCARSTNR